MWGVLSLSSGNLTVTSWSGTWNSVRSILSKSSGKWYWEYNISWTAWWNVVMWVGNSSATLTNYVGADANGWSLYTGWNKINSNVFTAYGTWSLTTGDVVWVALDMDAGSIKFLVNNTDLGVAFTWLTGNIFAMIAVINTNVNANFWASALTYSPPSGFNAWLYS